MKRPARRVALRIIKGGLVPADQLSTADLRKRGYKVGDVVFAELKKPRNPGFHRLAHRIGSLCAENIEAFQGIDSHAVLKRLQIESGVGCEEIPLNFPGIGPCSYKVPLSLSFESMEEGEFRLIVAGLCDYIAKRYWPSMTADQIERMAETWVEAA